MSAPAGWSAAFFDVDGEPVSRGWTSESLTDLVRRVLLRFDRHPEARYATIAARGNPFALVSVAGERTATVNAIAADERQMTVRERKALAHVENMLRSGVRLSRAAQPQWRLERRRPRDPQG